MTGFSDAYNSTRHKVEHDSQSITTRQERDGTSSFTFRCIGSLFQRRLSSGRWKDYGDYHSVAASWTPCVARLLAVVGARLNGKVTARCPSSSLEYRIVVSFRGVLWRRSSTSIPLPALHWKDLCRRDPGSYSLMSQREKGKIARPAYRASFLSRKGTYAPCVRVRFFWMCFGRGGSLDRCRRPRICIHHIPILLHLACFVRLMGSASRWHIPVCPLGGGMFVGCFLFVSRFPVAVGRLMLYDECSHHSGRQSERSTRA